MKYTYSTFIVILSVALYNEERGCSERMKIMQKRRLGSSDLYVSPISLGCMSIGTDEKQALQIIDKALDLGINYLDTADLYDKGWNEELVGKAIRQKRNEIILATKVGNHLQDDGTWYWDPSKAYIKQQVKESLRRLQTDYIDLYQLHGGTIDDPIDETIEAFEELVKEGVIRYYGISSIRPNVIREYVKRSNIVSVMMQFSLFDRRPEESILDLLAKNNISVVTRGTVAKGMLSNQGQAIIDKKGKDGYLSYTYEELKRTYLELESLLNEKQSMNGLAIQYVLSQPAVASAVIGGSSIQQLEENFQAYHETFSEDQIQQAQAVTQANYYKDHR